MSAAKTCNAAAAAAAQSEEDRKPILATRFKTSMCKNYKTKGSCPYEARCMFAHGDAELRTKKMNLADGLVTEEAIKAFQRAGNVATRTTAKKVERPAKKMGSSLTDSIASSTNEWQASATASEHGDEPSAADMSRRHSCIESDDDSAAPTMEFASATSTPSKSACGARSSPYVEAPFEYDLAKFVSPLAAVMLHGLNCQQAEFIE